MTTQNEHCEVIEALIEANAAVDAQKKYEVTALHLTAHNEHSEIIRILIKAKADVNASDEDH